MANRLDKFQRISCENSESLLTVVRADDGSLSLEPFPYPLNQNGTRVALSSLGNTWNKARHRERMCCACPLDETLQTPASLLTRRVTEEVTPDPDGKELSATRNYSIVSVACGRPLADKRRCSFRMSVNDILRRAGTDLYSQRWSMFNWMDSTSSTFLSSTLETNSKDHQARSRQKTQGGFPVSNLHRNSYRGTHRGSNSNSQTYDQPGISQPSGSGGNSTHKALNPYPRLKPATPPSSSPLSSNAPSSTFIYDGEDYDQTQQQAGFNCDICGGRELPLADLPLHEDYKCAALQQGRSFLSPPSPSRHSTQPSSQDFNAGAGTQIIPRPHGASITSAPTTSPPLPLPITDQELYNLREIKKAGIPSRHLFKCPCCEEWIPVEQWMLHKGGSCVSDTESDLNVPAVQAASGSGLDDDGMGRRTGVARRGRPSGGGTRPSKPSASVQSIQRVHTKRSVVMAATSESEGEITPRKRGPSRRYSNVQPTKRPRLSSTAEQTNSPTKNNTKASYGPPRLGTPKAQVEVIDLSSDNETAVIKTTGEQETLSVPEDVINLCSEDDANVDELAGDDGMSDESHELHHDDKAKEASVEELVCG